MVVCMYDYYLTIQLTQAENKNKQTSAMYVLWLILILEVGVDNVWELENVSLYKTAFKNKILPT